MAEALGLAVNCVTVIDLAAKIATTLYTYGREVSGARNDIGRIREHVLRLTEVVQSVQDLQERHGSGSLAERALHLIQESISAIEPRLNRLQYDLDLGVLGESMRRFGLRAWKWPFNQRQVEEIVKSLEDCIQTISQSLQMEQTTVLLDIDYRLLLGSIPHAEDAAFDSRVEEHNPTCHPQTRSGILSTIYEWVDDPEAKAIFWLNGMAGTGKSSISRTVCKNLSQHASLAASFFFKKGERNRGNCNQFFSTIAYQLALSEAAFAAALKESMTKDPGLVNKPLREQCKKLVIEPLTKIPTLQRRCSTLTVVVDALDECDDDRDIRTLIHLLSEASWHPLPWRLKILITSRPELPIRLGFGAIRGTFQDLILHEVPSDVVQSDLRIFLQDELGRIREDYNNSVPGHRQLQDPWPGTDSIERIAEMATPLFIFAATVCRFVSDRRGGSPDKQLHKFLVYQTRENASKLDAIYLPILTQMTLDTSDEIRHELLADFHVIVGSIILLANPLPAAGLASLLGLTADVIEDRLDLLHSVINVPMSPEKPVRLLHLSFRDFLTDEKQKDSNIFWVDVQLRHRHLASRCISVMEQLLCKDVRRRFGVRHESTPTGKDYEVVELPPHLRYACVSWIHHLTEAKIRPQDGDAIHKFLETHFLHWTEGVCALGPSFDLVGTWRDFGALIDQISAPALFAFHMDAYRILNSYLQLIMSTPMAVYSSMLMFAPTNSLIKQRYAGEIPDWITFKYDIPSAWDPLRVTFSYDAKEMSAYSMSISSGNRYLAFVTTTSFFRVVDLFSNLTTFSTRIAGTKIVAFSHDSSFVAVGGGGKLELFSPETGLHVQSLKAPGFWAFSPDSPHLGVESAPGVVEIMQVGAGTAGFLFIPHQTVAVPAAPKAGISLSKGRLIVISTYQDHQVEVWEANLPATSSLQAHSTSGAHTLLSCTHQATFSSPETPYRSKHADVVLSPNAMYMAVITPGTILRWRVEIYSLDDFVQTQVFESDNQLFATVVFSPKSQLVARDSGSGTINIRRPDQGKTTIAQLNQRRVTSLAFSGDASMLAVGSYGAVQLWDLWNFSLAGSSVGDTSTSRLDKPSMAITWVRISPDGSLAAVGTSSHKVQIWDLSTYECKFQLGLRHDDHTYDYYGVFSDDMHMFAALAPRGVSFWSLLDGGYMGREDNGRWIEARGHLDSLALIKGLPDITSIASINPKTGIGPCNLADFSACDDYRLVGGMVAFHGGSESIAIGTDVKGSYKVEVSRWGSLDGGEASWKPVMVCDGDDATVMTTRGLENSTSDSIDVEDRFDWGPVVKISRDGAYIVVAYITRLEQLTVDVWSLLDVKGKVGSFNCPLPRSTFRHVLEVCEGSSMTFGCPCLSLTVVYNNFDASHTSVVVHVCVCKKTERETAIPPGPPNTNEERVSFHLGGSLRRVHLSGRKILWAVEDVLDLPQTHQPKEEQGRKVFDSRHNKLVIGTMQEEVLIISIDRD